MDSFDRFEEVFSTSSENLYVSKDIDNIVRHRRMLDNTLFFDRLLAAVGLQNATETYPPSSLAKFKSLFTEIKKADASDTHKAAILYYLRKDVELAPEEFAQQCYLPERYVILINGLWHLDRLHLKEALTYLADPTLIPTFPQEILQTLQKHAPNHPELALEYYNSVSPALTTPEALNAYFTALATCSATEAFFFTRQQPESTRKHLFEYLVSRVHSASASENRAKQCVELVGLPFNDLEGKWFEDCLLKGKGKTLNGAKDSVIFRRIVSARSDSIGALAKDVKERKIDGVNWQDLVRQ